MLKLLRKLQMLKIFVRAVLPWEFPFTSTLSFHTIGICLNLGPEGFTRLSKVLYYQMNLDLLLHINGLILNPMCALYRLNSCVPWCFCFFAFHG